MDNIASVEDPKIPEVTITIPKEDSKTDLAKRQRVEDTRKALLSVQKAITKTGILTLDGKVNVKLAEESDKFIEVCVFAS